MTPAPPLLQAALAWHNAGASVVPVRADESKAPFGPWAEYQHQRPTEDQLHAWFTSGQYDGLGIICGAVSGGIEMFEIEGRAAHLAAELAQMMDDNGFGPLWRRITGGYLETSPSGGYHWLYRVQGEPAGNTKLARRPSTPDEFAQHVAQLRADAEQDPNPDVRARRLASIDRLTPERVPQVMIETRGEGGFTVLAPSAGRTHPTGRAWTALIGGPDTIPTITVEERDALHAIAATFDQMPAHEAPAEHEARGRGSLPGATEAGGVRPGDDYNTKATWDDILAPHGWTKTNKIGHGYGWTRPGKNPRDGISATTGQNDADNLYVFTTSTVFEEGRPYSKFAAYCVAPETKVLRADLTWAPAGDLAPGDAIVGVDEHIPAKNGRRKLRLAHIEQAERRVLPCYRITLADGRTITATDEHPWLASSAGKGGNLRWIQTQNLRPGQRIAAITDGTWDRATDFDSGWLSGMFDGEGWVNRTTVGIAQKDGPVLQRAKSLLLDRGFNVAHRARPDNGVHNLVINDLPSLLRLLGTLQPGRLVNKLPWVGRGAWTQAAPNAIVQSIEFVGNREVAAFMTTTRTFIAEGLISHNTLLEHGGDYTAAARELGRQGYGARPRETTLRVVDNDLDGLIAPAPRPTQTATPTRGANALKPDHTPPATITEHRMTLTDVGNSQLLIAKHAHHIRYVARRGEWLTWDGHRWATDDIGTVNELAKQTILDIDTTGDEAAAKHRTRSLSRRAIEAMVALARTDPAVAVLPQHLDAHPYHLCTPGGVVNLTTGQLDPADPADLHTRITTVAPDPTCPTPRWDRFLQQTFNGQADLIEFVQRLAGYSSLGVVTRHILPFLIGPGGNGKSVFLDVLRALLGDYAATTPAKFLMAGINQHETEIARLSGLRLVISSEVNEEDRFDEAKVKLLTGGDALTARFMHQNHFTFTPTHTLWLMGNHQPRVSSGGDSFWRRLRLVPFNYTVPKEERVEGLDNLLVEEEGPGILAWVVAGATKAIATGLQEPDVVMAATNVYASEEDHLARFIEDRVNLGGDKYAREPTAKVRQAYDTWCRDQGEKPMSPQAFGRELRTRFNVDQTRAHGVRYYTGLTLLADENDPDTAEEWWNK